MVFVSFVDCRLLGALSQALQSSGLDLSQANVSVQINLGKRAARRRTTNHMTNLRVMDSVPCYYCLCCLIILDIMFRLFFGGQIRIIFAFLIHMPSQLLASVLFVHHPCISHFIFFSIYD